VIAMALYYIAGALTALLLVYLFYVLSQPEGF
jgi:K+-transporting ATPase KdpF subunit